MSVLFLKQLRLHREQLSKSLNGRQDTKALEQELAQTRQFLTATKDQKWKVQLIKRIKQLEASKRVTEPSSDVKRRFELVNELYDLVERHPDYNKTRKRRAPKV
jgi:hypothetical protein